MDAIAENKELQEEERLAVCAIYGDSVLQQDQNNNTDDQTVYLLTLNVDQDDDADDAGHSNDNKSPRVMVLRLFLPSTYPLTDMPVFEMASLYCGNKKITPAMVDTIQQGFQELFQPGQVVLFEWIQWLRDYIEDTVDAATTTTTTTSAKDLSLAGLSVSGDVDNNDNDNKAEEVSAPTLTPTIPTKISKTTTVSVEVPSIFSSEPLVDRKSTFVAHVAHVKDAQQVHLVMATLLENKKIAKATHNIVAYRINLPGDRILQDNDDDGETAAGGRLMHLLQILDVKDVVVVVSRWYGGIQLGADRFKDINNCARKALEDCGYVAGNQQQSSSDKSSKKKGKK